MELLGKKSTEEKYRVKLIQKNLKIKNAYQYYKKHSAASEFHILPPRGKRMLTLISLKHQGVVTEKSCHLSEKRFDLLKNMEVKPIQPVNAKIF